MNKRILGMLVVVFLLIAGTTNVQAQRTEAKIESRQDARKNRHVKQIAVWQEKLDLNETQVASLEKEMESYIDAISEIKKDETLSKDQKKAAAARLGLEYEKKFEAVLTKEQLKLYREYKGYSSTSREKLKTK